MPTKAGTAYVDVVADFGPLNRQIGRMGAMSARAGKNFSRAMKVVSREAEGSRRDVARVSREVGGIGLAARASSRQTTESLRQIEAACARALRALRAVEASQRRVAAAPSPGAGVRRGGTPRGASLGSEITATLVPVISRAAVDAAIETAARQAARRIGTSGISSGATSTAGSRTIGPRGTTATAGGIRGIASSGLSLSKTFAGSFAKGLGPGLAVAGVERILNSALRGDMKGAGFKAGGALIGGLLGSFGGPAGAMFGAGLGTFAGELGEKIFDDVFSSGKRLSPLQSRLKAESKHVADSFKRQRAAARGLAQAYANLHSSQQRQKNTTGAVHRAEQRLSRDRRKYGADSNRVKRDEILLAQAKRKNAAATREVNQVQRLSGASLKLYNHLTVVAAASTKLRIRDLRQEARNLYRKWQQDKSNNDLAKRAQQRYSELNREQRKLSNLYQEAGAKSGPKLRRTIESLNLVQATYGRNLKGLSTLQAQLPHKTETATERALKNWESFTEGFKKRTAQPFKGDVRSMNRTANTGMVGTAQTANQLLAGMGVDTAQFHINKMGEVVQTKQAGGFIVPGATTGDSYRTNLPVGSFILNRRATAAFGLQRGGRVPVLLEPGERAFMPDEVRRVGQGSLEALNTAVPRFQKGGRLTEPQLMGPPGALRSIGQGAIHMVYEGAKEYMAKNKPKLGPIGFAGQTLTGKVSWFSGGATAGGSNTARPGLALNLNPGTEGGWNNKLTQGWMSRSRAGHPVYARVTIAGHTANLPITDLGPAGFTQRAIDVTEGGVRKLGLSTGHFPTDSIGTARILGMQRGGPIRKGGQPFDPVAMRGGPSASPRPAGGKSGFLPRTIDRIKAKADLIANQFTGYVWGGGHAEGTNVTANGLDCSGAIAKLMQQSGWEDFAVAHSSVYESRFHPGAGELFTIWSNDEHTFADIEGKQWGTNSSNGLGYHTHTHSGFVPRHPVLGSGKGGGASEGAAGAAAPAEDPVPKTIKGKYKRKKAVVGKGGGVGFETVLARYKVTTARLQFGGPPKDLHACQKELRQRQRELGEYRAAARQSKDKETKDALQVNVAALEGRIRDLKQVRSRLLRERHQKKAAAKLIKAAEFAAWNDPEKGILPKRREAYEILTQNAEQWVATEPEEPSFFEGNWVDSVLEPYVRDRERPAYAAILGNERDWRNDLIQAEIFAGGRIGAWKSRIQGLQDRIAWIRTLRKKDPKKWAQLSPKIPPMQTEMKDLRATIKKTRDEVIPAWVEELEEVQGIGRPHTLLDDLPTTPTAEQFGGYIWDTQTAIRDLDLKIKQAREGTQSGNGEREELYRQLLMESEQRNIVRGIEEKVFASMPKVGTGFQTGGAVGLMPPYAGKAHTGAVVPGPPGQERTMVVKSGEGIFTPEQMAALGGGGEIGPVRVNVNGDIVSSHPDPVEVLLGDRRLVAEIRKVTGRDNRRQARGAGRGLATPGVFSR